MFPYLADNADIRSQTLLLNRQYFRDWKQAFQVRAAQLQHTIKFRAIADDSIDLDPHSYEGGLHFADTMELEKLRNTRSEENNYWDTSFSNRIDLKYPKSYLEKIFRLCEANQIKIIFLYLPGYGAWGSPPKGEMYYKKYGKVLMPPDSLFSDLSNWMDDNHFNSQGAEECTTWLLEKL